MKIDKSIILAAILFSGMSTFATQSVASVGCPDLAGVFAADLNNCEQMSLYLTGISKSETGKDVVLDLYNLYGRGTSLPITIQQKGCEALILHSGYGPYTQPQDYIVNLSKAFGSSSILKLQVQSSDRNAAIKNYLVIEKNEDGTGESLFVINNFEKSTPTGRTVFANKCLLKKIK